MLVRVHASLFVTRGGPMSYVALATDSFDKTALFYGQALGLRVVAEWDRPRGRGRRYDLGGGLRLELLDNAREPISLELNTPRGRVQIVIEVEDIEVTRLRIALSTPEPQTVSWGASLFQLHDPDGIPVTFLQWL